MLHLISMIFYLIILAQFKRFMKAAIFVIFFFSFQNCFSQQLLLPNEEAVFSFKLKNGKTMMLAKEKKNSYLVYRFGKDNKIDFEFPERDSLSFKKFGYNFYFRGGGKENAGIDIDNLFFENAGYYYTVYSVYSAEDESLSSGIIVLDKNNKQTKLTAVKGSEMGSLQDFRTNDMIKIDLEAGLDF